MVSWFGRALQQWQGLGKLPFGPPEHHRYNFHFVFAWVFWPGPPKKLKIRPDLNTCVKGAYRWIQKYRNLSTFCIQKPSVNKAQTSKNWSCYYSANLIFGSQVHILLSCLHLQIENSWFLIHIQYSYGVTCPLLKQSRQPAPSPIPNKSQELFITFSQETTCEKLCSPFKGLRLCEQHTNF